MTRFVMAKAEEPRDLRRRIRQLEREVSAAENRRDAAVMLQGLLEAEAAELRARPAGVRVEVPVFTEADREVMRSVTEAFIAAAQVLPAAAKGLAGILERLEAVENAAPAAAFEEGGRGC